MSDCVLDLLILFLTWIKLHCTVNICRHTVWRWHDYAET